MRLDKFLVDCGLGSRTEVKQLLKKKTIQVNGQTETSPKSQVNPNQDQVTYAGQELRHQTFVYYLMNKPKGLISATEDRDHRTVLDLLDQDARRRGVFPVGRLDIDTHGLLLLTDNGPLAHAMLAPKKHVDKTYVAQVSGLMTAADQAAFAQGLELGDGFTCQPAQLDLVSQDETTQTCQVKITIQEGKFHQVKRMVKACGKEVTDLQRLTMGPLSLPADLARGDYRPLTDQELASLEGFGIPLR